MIKRTNILGYRINFVFRHKYEKDMDLSDKYLMWREYRLGLWLKPYKAVGKPKSGPTIIGKGGTYSKGYMLGVNLIICKFWVDICYRPLILDIDEK